MCRDLTKTWESINLTSEISLNAISALGCLFLSGWSCRAVRKKTQSPIINSRTWCKYNVDAFTEETYQVYGTAFG